MHNAQLRLTLPAELAEVIDEPPLRAALAGVAALAGGGLHIEPAAQCGDTPPPHAAAIRQQGRPVGQIVA